MTIRAYKGKQGPCYETYRQAIYLGPLSQVADDDGHIFERGKWERVCEKTANILASEPYAGQFMVTPALEDPAKKLPFDCSADAQSPQLSNEMQSRFNGMLDGGDCCAPGTDCC